MSGNSRRADSNDSGMARCANGSARRRSPYSGRQEGQFDVGLVNRMGNFQAGGFASFKYLNFSNYQNGGALGQAAVMVDYLFNGGKVGFFGTKGFKNYAVLNSVTLAPGAYFQTYARVADQAGIDALFGVWGKAYLQGDIGLIVSHMRSDQPGGSVKLVQPISEHVAFTAELGFNETYLNSKDSGRAVVGLAFGGFVNPDRKSTRLNSSHLGISYA